jgi:hypothetical protein
VTRSHNPLFAHEVIECVSEGRSPTTPELFRLAEQIWREATTDRSAFAWGQLASSDPERLFCLRAAVAAAVGTGEYLGTSAILESSRCSPEPTSSVCSPPDGRPQGVRVRTA